MPKVVPEYKETAKTKIIGAAQKVFSEKGYHAATMDDIAAEIGVSKGALYSYFKSKEDLIKEISLQSHQTLRDIIDKACESHNLTAALDGLYAEITEKYKGNIHTNFELISLASHDPKTRKIIMDDFKNDIKTVEAFAEDIMSRGGIRNDVSAHAVAELFTALYVGTMAKLAIGFDSKEVQESWVESMMLILGKHKPQS